MWRIRRENCSERDDRVEKMPKEERRRGLEYEHVNEK